MWWWWEGGGGSYNLLNVGLIVLEELGRRMGTVERRGGRF